MYSSAFVALIVLQFAKITTQQPPLQLQECDSTCFSSAAEQVSKSSGCADNNFPCLCHHGDFMIGVGRCLKNCFAGSNGVDANGRARFICQSLFVADPSDYEGLAFAQNKSVQRRQEPETTSLPDEPTTSPPSEVPSPPPAPSPETPPTSELPTTGPSETSVPPLWSAASPEPAPAPAAPTPGLSPGSPTTVTDTVNGCAACSTTTVSPSQEATLLIVPSTVFPTTMTTPPESFCETTTVTTSITNSMTTTDTTGTTTSTTGSRAAIQSVPMNELAVTIVILVYAAACFI